mmetsp:Transcript_5769/g.12940  ORF Transcript_5769/g.12940 Transcript_5769/m.12940 type:complete len:104 (-) Transcript_5769:147-458(-)
MAAQRSTGAALVLLFGAALLASLAAPSAFVQPAGTTTDVEVRMLRGAEPAAVATAFGALAAAVPEPALAATEKELNTFGGFFAVFFLFFFVAGMGRLLTEGKL